MLSSYLIIRPFRLLDTIGLSDLWRKQLGKAEFVAFQASARGGGVRVRVVKDRALLGGRAVTVARGELLVEGDEP